MEALGAISSVFAVVSLALQLSSNIQHLIEFWDSVNEAPDEIAQIKSQLRVVGELLRCIEDDIQDPTNEREERMGTQCLQLCNASIMKLERVTKELDTGLSGNGLRRRWTCLRKALRERQLASYWDEIERTKSVLIMYQGWRNGRRQECLLAMTLRLHPDFAPRPSCSTVAEEFQISRDRLLLANKVGFTKVFLESAIIEFPMSFGTFRVQTSTHITKPRGCISNGIDALRKLKQQQITASFIPGFLLSSAFELTLTWGYRSETTFKIFNVRPGWSPIFKYAALGDFDNVRRLLEDGSASLNDVDEDGWTPLHYAASCHHALLCQMLIDIGAATDPVTYHQETPLMLATDKNGYEGYHRHGGTSSVDTVRVLVQQGKNDPMQENLFGNTSIINAASNKTDPILPWLLKQDDCGIDLRYKTPSGHTAAAYISMRDDVPGLLPSLLKSGISAHDPCAKYWYFYHLPKDRLGEPSMIHYAVWTWYDKLLSFNDTGHLRWGRRLKDSERPVPPCATIRSLLEHGADLHDQTTSGHTILDGMFLDLIQFDGSARPHDVTASCFATWLSLVQCLDFDVKDYLRREKNIHDGVSHDLGLGLSMEIRVSEEPGPWAWPVFQGPEERERGEFANHITRCYVWPEWQRKYALPNPPPPWPATLFVWNPKAFAVLRSIDNADTDVQTEENIDNSAERPNQLRSRIFILVWKARRYAILGARYRLEFSFYFAAFISLLGFGYFARVWITWLFYLSLKLAGYTVS